MYGTLCQAQCVYSRANLISISFRSSVPVTDYFQQDNNILPEISRDTVVSMDCCWLPQAATETEEGQETVAGMSSRPANKAKEESTQTHAP